MRFETRAPPRETAPNVPETSTRDVEDAGGEGEEMEGGCGKEAERNGERKEFKREGGSSASQANKLCLTHGEQLVDYLFNNKRTPHVSCRSAKISFATDICVSV